MTMNNLFGKSVTTITKVSIRFAFLEEFEVCDAIGAIYLIGIALGRLFPSGIPEWDIN